MEPLALVVVINGNVQTLKQISDVFFQSAWLDAETTMSRAQKVSIVCVLYHCRPLEVAGSLGNRMPARCVLNPFPPVCFVQRDSTYLKQEFVKVYMSSVYFLLHLPSLPCYRWADSSSEEQRARVIYAILDSLKHTQHTSGQCGAAEVFTDPMHEHLAFDVSELTFDLLRMAR